MNFTGKSLAATGARVIALLLVCATAPAQAPAAQGSAPIWIDIPFVHQPPEGCGAASIAMVMNYWAAQPNVHATTANVDSIQRELVSPRQRGITPEQMETYLRAHGFQVFALNGTWADLNEQLRKGRPLIVALRPHGQRELHFVVIDGIDSVRGLVTVNDPAQRKLLTRERAGFEREWSATHNWMLLALPTS